MREADVPGRRPNVAERADNILTSTKIIKGLAARGTGQARPGETLTGTSGTQAAMYEIEGINDEQLHNTSAAVCRSMAHSRTWIGHGRRLGGELQQTISWRSAERRFVRSPGTAQRSSTIP
jgi:hypothetical protein